MFRILGTFFFLSPLVFADISGNNPPCGKCLCADVSNTLNVRDAPYGNVVASISDGECYRYTGGKQVQGSYTWFSFDYNGNGNIWSAGEFMEYGSSCSTSNVCMCVTASSLNARATPSTSGTIVPPSLSNGECYAATGDSQDANGYTWHELIRGSGTVWAAGNWLTCDGVCPAPPASDPCGQVTIVSRSEWGARSTTTDDITKPVDHVFIHHTTGGGCTTTTSCKSRVKGIQDYHIDDRGYSDIGYSFLIGGDGKVYEGRGWDKQGAHTYRYNDVGFGISFIGDYSTVVPSTSMLDAAKNLIACGVEEGNIASDYSLAGHSDTKCTACPGAALYGEVKTWDNWHKLPNYNDITYQC